MSRGNYLNSRANLKAVRVAGWLFTFNTGEGGSLPIYLYIQTCCLTGSVFWAVKYMTGV